MAGGDNAAADFLSRIEQVSDIIIDYASMAAEQKKCPELRAHLDSTDSVLQLKLVKFDDNVSIYCDLSTNRARLIVPKTFRQKVVLKLHNISHAGVKASTQYVKERFVWCMSKEVKHLVNVRSVKFIGTQKQQLEIFQSSTDLHTCILISSYRCHRREGTV